MLKPVAEAAAFPEALRQAEWPHADRAPRLGLGLSGGGIRSATLSLGFFQGLARLGLLPRIDYLSTVSGGGYFGAFYGHLLQRKATVENATDPVAAAQEELAHPSSRPVSFLRNNGRYLSPNGSGDLLLGAAIAVRNWVAVMIVMSSLALLVLALVVLLNTSLLEAWLPWALPGIAVGPLLVQLSPLFVAALVMLVVLAVPPGWAYWLVPSGDASQPVRQLLGRWAAPVAGLGALVGANQVPGVPRSTLLAFGAVSGLTVACYVLARWLGRRKNGAPDADTLTAGATSVARGKLSRWLTRMMIAVGCVLAVALVDTIGATLAALAMTERAGPVVSGYAVLGALITLFRRRLAALTNRHDPGTRLPIPTSLLVNVGAVVLMLALLGGVAAIPHLVLARGGTAALAWLLGGAAALVVAIGGVWPFVNRSSLHAVYEARLRRAYLGATNPARAGEGQDFPPVTDPHAEDGLARAAYHPEQYGGPVHLINVTVNETVDGRSQVQQRDRKGVGMAIGPAGVSVSKQHHALWGADEAAPGLLTRVKEMFGFGAADTEPAKSRATGFRVFPTVANPEDLDIGQWVAISGAAFSTGLGSRTSLGFSLLAGLFNIRLGYWWWSGVDPEKRTGRARRSWMAATLARLRRLCPVQASLLDEWLARFPGVARQEWYLSDGGHFENLGGYELIRRRLPLILLCDNEQDADYEFPGLGNLVRKARTDFGTEITFLTLPELARTFGGPESPNDWRHWIGPLEALRRGARQRDDIHDPVTGEKRVRITVDRREYSLAHAAVATVDYPAIPAKELKASRGWLLYLKPTLVGGEPADLAHYHREHPDFPHQSTGDQFFDEAQWESYRALGGLIATRLFAGAAGAQASLLESLDFGSTARGWPQNGWSSPSHHTDGG